MDLTTHLRNCSSASNEIRKAAEEQLKQLRISNPVP